MSILFNFFKFFSIFPVILALTACGGGGGSQQSPPAEGLGGVPLQYIGNTKFANITPENAYELMELVFMFGGNISGNDFCEVGDIDLISGELNLDGNGSLLLEYANCQIDGIAINGKVQFDVEQEGIENTLTFNTLTFTDEAGIDIRFSGSIHTLQDTLQFCDGFVETYNVIINESNTDKYYQAQNLQVMGENYCDLDLPSTITGRVYHSDYGYVEVSTLSPYSYVKDFVDNTNAYFPDRAGHIRVLGANKSSAEFQVVIDQVFKQSTIDAELIWVQFSVDSDGDGQFDNTAGLPTLQFEDGASSDLRDSDNDGLINSWEVYFGLDPNNSEDAELDKDGDGYSNLNEYLYFGDPGDVTDVPLITDLSIEFGSNSLDIRAGQTFRFDVNIENPNQLFGAEGVVVTLGKPQSINWVNLPGNCTSTSQVQVQCNVHNISQDSAIRLSVQVVSDEPGSFLFTASVESATFDSAIANNSAQMIQVIKERSVNLGVEVFRGEALKDHEFAIIGENTSYELGITQWGDQARNTVLSMNIPENINIESAEFTVSERDGPRTGSCDIGSNLVCLLGTIPFNGASYKATLDIEVSGISEGVANQTINVSSEGVDSDLSDNEINFTTFVGQSLASIQSSIDSADPGDTIVIPNGLYVGSLSLISGNINIESESGKSSTSIWLTDSSDLGQSTSVRNITFYGRGNLVATDTAGVEIADNLFINMPSAINFTQTSGEIYNNRFMGGVGNPLNCSQVKLNYYMSGFGFDTSVFNNIFHNISSERLDCIALWVAGFVDDGQRIEITNNTFFENDIAMLIVKPRDPLSSINIINNIMQGNRAGLSVAGSTSGAFEPAIYNNLTYQNGSDFFGVSPAQLVDNISGDPLMIDPSGENFRLSAGSIAVDAGLDVSAPLFDFFNNPRPVDGDGDGVSATDIGAHEATP